MWHGIDVKKHAQPETLSGFRVVEDQQYNSTYKLVDNEAEHFLLEQMLEDKSKPHKPQDCPINDYLLFTPFRYPPLHAGTRFGTMVERSPFYGSEQLEAALAEKAYRIQQFDYDTAAKMPNRQLSYTSFQFLARAMTCLNVIEAPFDVYFDIIHDPNSLLESQALGTEMRHNAIDSCLFMSVRQTNIKNIAIFDPAIFTQKSKNHAQWQCLISSEEIVFINNHRHKHIYKRDL